MTIVSLNGKKRIAETFRSGKRFSTPAAVLIAVYSKQSEAAESVAMMVVVRKKIARKAVVRNRIRRLVRESVRRALASFTAEGIPVPFTSLVFMWNSAPKRPSLLRLDAVELVVRPLLERASTFTVKPRRATQ